MKRNTIHKDFQLNGTSFSSIDDLLAYAKKISQPAFLFLSDWFSTSDVLKVATSGSTEKPKLIALKKEFMVNSALATGTYFDLKERTSALMCLPVDYIAGKMMLVRALVLGWHIDVVLPTSNPLKELENVYDFSAMVPLQLQNSLSELFQIKKLIVGGGQVSKELQVALQNVSTHVYATYGMTETITHIAVQPLNKSQSLKGVYQILPNIVISQDSRNCLVINAPEVSENTINTNDVIRIISNTEFEWLGRIDNVINSGGIKLHPEQIEQKLSTIINQRFFVAGISDKKLGEKLIMIVEGNKQNSIFEKIKQLNSLSKFEIPKEIYFLPKFVETETKKIQRKKTLDLLY
ncbi:MAG: AMP-binding protein [Flavobacteriaceae bacterium]|nr:AMP-binding protein [Flavobacteriaceae bacterium]